MTVYRIPDDFPLISLALASPLVRGGDTILVQEGAGPEVVAVPPDKTGIRIMADGYAPLVLPGEDEAGPGEEDFSGPVTAGAVWEEIVPEDAPAGDASTEGTPPGEIAADEAGVPDVAGEIPEEPGEGQNDASEGDAGAGEEIPPGDVAGEVAETEGSSLITITKDGVTLFRRGGDFPSAIWVAFRRRH